MTLPKTYVKGFHDEDAIVKMKYRLLGKTGLKISKVSLGGGTFSDLYGGFEETEAIATVHQAIKCGINFLDTAPFYGQGKSEELYGKALKDIPRQAYYICTKVGRYEKDIKKMFDFSAKKTRESVEKSLKLLGLDYIDLIHIHDVEFAPNMDIIIKETIPALEELVKEGKIRFISLSGYPLNSLKRLIEAAPNKFQAVLTYSRNTLFDSALVDYLPFFKEQNVGVICAAGLGMGILTNSGPQDWHPASDELKSICKKASKICEDGGIELAKLATFHFMKLEGPATYLTGMQNRKLLKCILQTYYNGLTKKEQEVYEYLVKDVFLKFVNYNWEGTEVDKYWLQLHTK